MGEFEARHQHPNANMTCVRDTTRADRDECGSTICRGAALRATNASPNRCKNEKLILHQLGREGTIIVGGGEMSWASPDEGDLIELCFQTLVEEVFAESKLAWYRLETLQPRLSGIV